MSNKASFSILVPFYNPSEGWEQKIEERYLEFCSSIHKRLPLVLINDGSSINVSKGIQYLVEKLGSDLVYLQYPVNKGKGGALKYGVSKIDTSRYLFTDIDFPYDTESMVKVYYSTLQNAGIIIGYREQDYYVGISAGRKYISKGLRWINNHVLRLPVNDTQCGLKAFDNDVKQILSKCSTDRFLIDLELLLAISNTTINITTIVVKQRSDLKLSKFNFSLLIEEFWTFIQLLLKYRLFSRSKK